MPPVMTMSARSRSSVVSFWKLRSISRTSQDRGSKAATDTARTDEKSTTAARRHRSSPSLQQDLQPFECAFGRFTQKDVSGSFSDESRHRGQVQLADLGDACC